MIIHGSANTINLEFVIQNYDFGQMGICVTVDDRVGWLAAPETNRFYYHPIIWTVWAGPASLDPNKEFSFHNPTGSMPPACQSINGRWNYPQRVSPASYSIITLAA